MRELIKRWRSNGFTLFLWDTGKRDWRGQTNLAYRLWDKGRIIFEGEDFSGSPLHADDSNATIASLLSFLSLNVGDTDREYFANYTPAQIEWRDSSRRDELAMIQIELEETSNRA